MTNKELKLLGTELKRLRLINQYTLEEVAKILGVTHKSVQFWEQGVNEIKLSRLLVLAKVYNTTIDDILKNSNL